MKAIVHRTYLGPFGRYPVLGRIAVVAVLGEVVFASVNNYALPFYVLDDLRGSGRMLGVLTSTYLIVEMALKLPFGHLSDRYGRRLFAAGGLGLCVLAPVVICAIPTEVFLVVPALIFVVLMPLRTLDGVGAAALWPPLFASVADTVPHEQRGVGMSVINTAYLAGLALGPSLGGLAMRLSASQGAPEEWTAKAPFALAAVAALGGALAASARGGLPARRTRVASSAGRTEGQGPGRRTIALVMAITFGEMFAVAMLSPYLAPYLREVTGIARRDVGFLLLLPAGLLGIPIGHLTDRWPKRRVVKAALWTAALALWLVPACRSLVVLLTVGVAVMVGFLFGLPAWMALIADLAPEGRSGRMMGLMATAQGLGAFLGPLAGGFLWDVNIRYPWCAAAAMLSGAALTAVAFLRGPGAGGGRRGGEVQMMGA